MSHSPIAPERAKNGRLNPLQQVPGVRSALWQAAAQLKKHLF
ncbi:hypothetical protein [Sodalis sp. dw_96]|nr:hypothetical protein [Sodalis sp. dw_96]